MKRLIPIIAAASIFSANEAVPAEIEQGAQKTQKTQAMESQWFRAITDFIRTDIEDCMAASVLSENGDNNLVQEFKAKDYKTFITRHSCFTNKGINGCTHSLSTEYTAREGDKPRFTREEFSCSREFTTNFFKIGKTTVNQMLLDQSENTTCENIIWTLVYNGKGFQLTESDNCYFISNDKDIKITSSRKTESVQIAEADSIFNRILRLLKLYPLNKK